MKKEDIFSIFIFIILAAGGFISVYTIGAKFAVDFMSRFWFALLTIVIAIIFNIVGLEGLHALGGKLGGYEVNGFNVFGFGWRKVKGKWNFKFNEFDGLGGEVKLAPKKEKTNLKPFIWIPIIGYVVEFALGFALIKLATSQDATIEIPQWLAYGALLFLVVSTAIALYNLIPIKLDSMTDGYRLILISNPINKEAYDELMRVESLQINGENVGEIKTFDVVSEFTAEINLLSVYDNLSKKNFEKGLQVIEMMLEQDKKINEITRNRLMSQKLYILLMSDLDKANDYYDTIFKDKERRFLANDLSAESLRAYALVAGILDDSQSEVSLVAKRFKKVLKETPETRAKIEEKLFNEAIEKILEKNKDWKKEDIFK